MLLQRQHSSVGGSRQKRGSSADAVGGMCAQVRDTATSSGHHGHGHGQESLVTVHASHGPPQPQQSAFAMVAGLNLNLAHPSSNAANAPGSNAATPHAGVCSAFATASPAVSNSMGAGAGVGGPGSAPPGGRPPVMATAPPLDLGGPASASNTPGGRQPSRSGGIRRSFDGMPQ